MTPTRLQREIADRILLMLREDGLGAGARLNENSTARRLNVSRTPVRAALAYLAEQGVVRRNAQRGIEVVAPPLAAADAALVPDATERVLVRIAHDRESGELADVISEMEVMRRYDIARPETQRLLARLADLGMVERKPGYGWRFLQEPRDASIHDEGYRFRMLIEPAAILEPAFQLPPGWLDEMRARHHATLARPWRETSSVAFYEMNAEFHEGLAAASGNRFLHGAIRRQNQLRRLGNYDWIFGFARVEVNCREHLQILGYLETGDREVASALMRRHLQRASVLVGPEDVGTSEATPL